MKVDLQSTQQPAVVVAIVVGVGVGATRNSSVINALNMISVEVTMNPAAMIREVMEAAMVEAATTTPKDIARIMAVEIDRALVQFVSCVAKRVTSW